MKYLIIVFMLSGCVTPYQKEGLSGGYSEIKFGQDMFQVSFTGNGYTPGNQVQKMFLRRCAELTIEQGYQFFNFVDQENNTENQVSNSYRNGRNNINVVTKHMRTGVIKLYKEDSKPQIAYEAKEVLTSLSGN